MSDFGRYFSFRAEENNYHKFFFQFFFQWNLTVFKNRYAKEYLTMNRKISSLFLTTQSCLECKKKLVLRCSMEFQHTFDFLFFPPICNVQKSVSAFPRSLRNSDQRRISHHTNTRFTFWHFYLVTLDDLYTMSPKSMSVLKMFQKRFMPFHRPSFNLLWLFCLAKLAMIDSPKFEL